MLGKLVTALALWAGCCLTSNADPTGARGVDVNGVLYEVDFRDGSRVDLFSGCDSLADFTFTTSALLLSGLVALASAQRRRN
jgi:hypothetical protein